MVSSTDAATVFAVLRGSRLHLKRRVGVTLEVESGINDPAAVILTLALTQNLVEHGTMKVTELGLDILVQLAVGTVIGLAAGYGGRFLLKRLQVSTGGLYPAVTLAIAFLAFGVATLLLGSGFLVGLSGRPDPRQRAAALPGRTPPGARRHRLALADRDVSPAGSAGLPVGTRRGRPAGSRARPARWPS